MAIFTRFTARQGGSLSPYPFKELAGSEILFMKCTIVIIYAEKMNLSQYETSVRLLRGEISLLFHDKRRIQVSGL